VFVDEIQFVLVVATPVDVILLGVTFDDRNVHNPMHLYPTNFTVVTDNVHMLKIIGTPSGRIFMCGKDGCLYEFCYQAGDGWFSRRSRKVNHSASLLSSLLPSFVQSFSTAPLRDVVFDPTRQMLFTLSQRGAISAYLVGREDGQLAHVCTHSSVLQESREELGIRSTQKGGRNRVSRTRAYPGLTPQHARACVGATGKREDWHPASFRIVSIFPIPVTESSEVVLVAVTNHAHRIFFVLKERKLRIAFIRLCPPSTSGLHDPQRGLQKGQCRCASALSLAQPHPCSRVAAPRRPVVPTWLEPQARAPRLLQQRRASLRGC
jgi:hypothetical protein